MLALAELLVPLTSKEIPRFSLSPAMFGTTLTLSSLICACGIGLVAAGVVGFIATCFGAGAGAGAGVVFGLTAGVGVFTVGAIVACAGCAPKVFAIATLYSP